MLKEIIKELIKEEFSAKTITKPTAGVGSSLDQQFVGQIVMIRTYSAGVHFGELIEKNGVQASLKDSRRVWSWAKACSLSQLAMEGSKDIASCKIAMPVDLILLERVIEVIPMRDAAIANLNSAVPWRS